MSSPPSPMALAFEGALASMVQRMNTTYAAGYSQPYVSMASEPAADAAYQSPSSYAPTHRWTFFTLAGHYAEVTLDAGRLQFVVHQFIPHPVIVCHDINMAVSASENLARVMGIVSGIMRRKGGDGVSIAAS